MGLDSMSVWRRGTTLAEEKERTNARVMHATTLHFIKNARDFRSRNTAAKFRKATWYNCCRVQFIRADRNETPSRAWNLANKSRVKKIQNSFFRSYPIWLIFFFHFRNGCYIHLFAALLGTLPPFSRKREIIIKFTPVLLHTATLCNTTHKVH